MVQLREVITENRLKTGRWGVKSCRARIHEKREPKTLPYNSASTVLKQHNTKTRTKNNVFARRKALLHCSVFFNKFGKTASRTVKSFEMLESMFNVVEIVPQAPIPFVDLKTLH